MIEKKKTRLLFVDIDGVFNHDSFYHDRKDNDIPYPLSEFDPNCVERYNRIIRETGAKTVISSSWRHAKGLRNIMDRVGFCMECLDFDITPCLGTIRGLEIRSYMEDYMDNHLNEDVESYCIIDDDVDMLYTQKDNFVVCDVHNGGLTDEKAEEVINILRREGGISWRY